VRYVYHKIYTTQIHSIPQSHVQTSVSAIRIPQNLYHTNTFYTPIARTNKCQCDTYTTKSIPHKYIPYPNRTYKQVSVRYVYHKIYTTQIHSIPQSHVQTSVSAIRIPQNLYHTNTIYTPIARTNKCQCDTYTTKSIPHKYILTSNPYRTYNTSVSAIRIPQNLYHTNTFYTPIARIKQVSALLPASLSFPAALLTSLLP